MLSAAQPLINRRIAQAAGRRTSAPLDRLAAGLTGDGLAPGSVPAGALSGSLRAG